MLKKVRQYSNKHKINQFKQSQEILTLIFSQLKLKKPINNKINKLKLTIL